MSNKDRQLGMHLPITRRDFVSGVGVALTTAETVGDGLAVGLGDPVTNAVSS